jgi:hypothetical protein
LGIFGSIIAMYSRRNGFECWKNKLQLDIRMPCFSGILFRSVPFAFLKILKEKITLVSAVLSSQVLRSRSIIFMTFNPHNLMNQTFHVLENKFGLMGTFYYFKRLENFLYIPHFVVI